MCDWTESLEKLAEGLLNEMKNFGEEIKKAEEKAEETGEPQCFIFAGEKFQISADGELFS